MDVASQIFKILKKLKIKSELVIKMEVIYEIKIIFQNIRLTGANFSDNKGVSAKVRNKMADILAFINSF